MCDSISEEEFAALLKRISAKGRWDTQVVPLKSADPDHREDPDKRNSNQEGESD